jgi:hypothetical protein
VKHNCSKKEETMPATPAFYSVNEAKKPASEQVHHNNSACRPGQDIPQNERKPGTNGYRLCQVCDGLNKQGK